MDEKLRELLALAFRTDPALEANTAIDAARAAESIDGEPARSYELAVPEGATFDWLLGSALPKLVYHLESVRARPPAFNGMVLSLFAGENLLFVHAEDFLPAAARLAGTTIEDLYARFGTGERRTSVSPSAPLKSLPAKP